MLMLSMGHFVTSFEPFPGTFEALAAGANATLEELGTDHVGQIKLINAAASDTPGTSKIFVEPYNHGNSIVAPTSKDGKAWTPGKLEAKSGYSQTYIEQTIHMTTLDDVIKWPVDVFKLDAQVCTLQGEPLRHARHQMNSRN